MAKTPTTMSDPTFLEAALEGLELQRQRIEQQIRDVQALLGKRRGRQAHGAEVIESAARPKTGRKRELSEAARKRIAAAQKKRWAEYRKAERQQKQD